MFSFLLSRFLRVEILGRMEVWLFKETADFYKVDAPLGMSAAMHEGFNVPNLHYTCYCLSDSSHPGGGGLDPKSCLTLATP